MEPAAQPAIQIHNELERREAGVGRTPRGRVWGAPSPATYATTASATTTAAAAATAPRSTSEGSSPTAAGGHLRHR